MRICYFTAVTIICIFGCGVATPTESTEDLYILEVFLKEGAQTRRPLVNKHAVKLSFQGPEELSESDQNHVFMVLEKQPVSNSATALKVAHDKLAEGGQEKWNKAPEGKNYDYEGNADDGNLQLFRSIVLRAVFPFRILRVKPIFKQ